MQQLKERGNTFLKRNKLDRALEMYTEALKVVPDNANLRKQIQITLREVCVVMVCIITFKVRRFCQLSLLNLFSCSEIYTNYKDV